jgi:RNA recognition motif-containing protein
VKSIYVGNFPYSTTEDELRALFEQHGTVHSLNLVTDRESGRSRGFAFVEMDEGEANAAIAALNGMEFEGRDLRVNEARPRRESGRRGSDRQRRGRRRQDRQYD